MIKLNEPNQGVEIVEKLSHVQAELKARQEDILEAVKPLLAKYGLIVTLTDDLRQIGERYYIQATATVTDKEGSQISVNAFAREPSEKKGWMRAKSLERLQAVRESML